MSRAEEPLGDGDEELEEGGDAAEEPGSAARLRHGEDELPEDGGVGVPPELALRGAAILEHEAGAGELGGRCCDLV